MRILLTIILMGFIVLGFSQTQADMNIEAYKEYHISDSILNQTYKRILSEYANDSLFIRNLKISQRIWIQFRDSELNLKYPQYPENTYGIIHPLCTAYYLKDLTDERVKTLKIWLDGIEEGDACSGSVKMKEEK